MTLTREELARVISATKKDLEYVEKKSILESDTKLWFGFFFKFGKFLFCSDAENEDDDADADETENDENMDTTEAVESRPRNPEDEYNFADYDNEGMRQRLLSSKKWMVSKKKWFWFLSFF